MAIERSNDDLKTGAREVWRQGFFTREMVLRGKPPSTVERSLGFRSGRLDQGWWVLRLIHLPVPEDFEFRAYSHMSGGVAQGHLANPPDPRNAEQRLRDAGADLRKLKVDIIASKFRVTGGERLAKAVPRADRTGTQEQEYPPGEGVEQWELVRPMRWQVAAFVPPGALYAGAP